jgi:hypothetical protein
MYLLTPTWTLAEEKTQLTNMRVLHNVIPFTQEGIYKKGQVLQNPPRDWKVRTSVALLDPLYYLG